MTFRTGVLVGMSIILQNAASSQQPKAIILNYADSLVTRIVGGETVRVASGHVEFHHGNVIVRCDQATHFFQRNEVVLVGNVTATRDNVTISADRSVYYGNERRMESEGNVRLKDDELLLLADFGTYFPEEHRAHFWQNVTVFDTASVIKADELTYYEDEDRTIALGNVRLIDDENRMVVFGERLEHDDARGYTRVVELPRLLQIDTTAAGTVDTLVVRSRVMESIIDSTRRYIATDSVTLVRGEFASASETTIFYPEQNRIILRKNPTLWYSRTQVSGDSIDIFLRYRRLHRVVVMGRAVAISQSDSLFPRRFDQLTGETITMTLSEEKIHRIEVRTTATSLYYLYDEGKPNGVNLSSGDAIIMSFNDGVLSDFTVIGGVQGQYFPEIMVGDRESEYNLPGFEWKKNRPRRSP